MTTTTDPRVIAYLHRLEEAASDLPVDRRVELVDQIRDHIATRLAEVGMSASGDDPVDSTLDRLGEPEEIVAAANENRAVELDGSHGTGAPEGVAAPVAGGLRGLEAAALVLLLLGGFVVGVGWLVGVVLLWMSPRWRAWEKLLGTLVWPGGLAGLLLIGGLLVTQVRTTACPTVLGPDGEVIQQCTEATTSPLRIVVMVVFGLAPLVVVTYLGVRASRRVSV